MMDIYGDYYNPTGIISYGRAWNFSTGTRSIGKSTGFSIYVLLDYLKTGHKFVYVRRTKEEVEKTAENYFDNAVEIIRAYKNNRSGVDKVEFDSGMYYVTRSGKEEREQCGIAIPLSAEQKYKSANMSEYFNILYDEFIARDSTGYLGSQDNFLKEYYACLSLFQTIDRGISRPYRNEAKMFFIANNASYYNPIYVALGIDEYIRTDTKVLAPKDKPWIVEQTAAVPATSEYMQSNVYMLSDESNRKYAFENTPTDTDNKFVGVCKAPMKALFNCVFEGHEMGVYYVEREGIVYVSNRQGNCYDNIALTTSDHRINYQLVGRYNNYTGMVTLRECFSRGRILFETVKCKYDIINYLKLTPSH